MLCVTFIRLTSGALFRRFNWNFGLQVQALLRRGEGNRKLNVVDPGDFRVKVLVRAPKEVWVELGSNRISREEVFERVRSWELEQDEVELASRKHRVVDVRNERFVRLLVDTMVIASCHVAGLNWILEEHFRFA